MFPSENMNPMVAYPATISEFTIKLLEDFGWYRGDNAHQRYVYLKGDGCSTVMGGECNSNKSEEFCSADERNQDHCYPNKLGKSHCGGGSQFTGQCRFQSPSFNGLCTSENDQNSKRFSFESYGPHSRCVIAENRAACLRMRCNKADKKVEIQIGADIVECKEEGPMSVQTSAFNGSIKCPSYEDMCEEV